MYKLLIAGALLLLLMSGVNAAQNPVKVYGPTLKEYAAVTCKLQKANKGYNAYKAMSLQTRQQKLWNRLNLQTAQLTPAQRVQYTNAYTKAMRCTQPKHKPFTAEQYRKLGCKNSKVSTKKYLTTTAGDSKMLQRIGKTKMMKNMYEKEMAKQMQRRKQQLQLRKGIDPCKKYNPLDHIPD